MDPRPLLDWMKTQGLRPNHTFLDIGCGRLRSTCPDLIGYLDAGRYFGLDIYRSMFEYNGTHPTVYMKLDAAGLADKGCRFWQTDDFDCAPLGDVRPDFALAQSVFSHIRPPLIARCLDQLRPHLHPGSVFYATYFRASGDAIETGRPHKGRPAPQPGVEEIDRIGYPDAVLAEIATAHGFRFEHVPGYPHPDKQQMAAFRLA